MVNKEFLTFKVLIIEQDTWMFESNKAQPEKLFDVS